MMLKLLAGAVAALGFVQAAMADVTYTYTGAKFDNVNVLTLYDPEVPPENALAESARVKAILLNDRIGLTLTTQFYLPAGWNTIDYTGFAGAPGTSVDWRLTNSAFGGSGHIEADNVFNYDPWLDPRLSVSLHVGTNHAIDAWQFSMEPDDAHGPPTWHILMTSSSTTGDSLLYEFGANHGYQRQQAATTTIGAWTLVGSPVPEPGTALLMLAGLGALGVALRQRRA